MISDDEAHRALAALAEFGLVLSGSVQTVMRQEVELSRKVADMKLPYDQEQLIYNVLTLPQEALSLLREHLGIIPKQNATFPGDLRGQGTSLPEPNLNPTEHAKVNSLISLHIRHMVKLKRTWHYRMRSSRASPPVIA